MYYFVIISIFRFPFVLPYAEIPGHPALTGLPLLPVDTLTELGAPWIESFVAWQEHLAAAKAPNEAALSSTRNPDLVAHATIKVLRMLGFVLGSDWAQFPGARGNGMGMRLREEQRAIRVEIADLHACSGQSGRWAEARREEARGRVVDFARRLSKLY